MQKKIFTGFVITSAMIYAFALYYMLFRGFGRENVLMSDGMKPRYAYNLIPFKTINQYIRVIANDFYTGYAVRNLAGNLLLLVPLGFYLPFFVKRLAKIILFVPLAAVFIISIEVIQLVTFTGSLDVDDFILNFAGAVIGLLVCKYTPVRRLFELRAY